MVLSKKYIVLRPFFGEPKNSDFKIVEEELPDLQDDEFLAKAAYISVDPYQRMKLGDKYPCDMIGGQIAKNSAYFGFTQICQPKPGETVVVSGAAGAVGSHVGQIAKILGCRVIGFAGTDEKCKWLTNDLGFDAAANYKNVNIATFLRENAPNGVDCYFDNVGGEISSVVVSQMNLFGRVATCGAISSYNETESEKRKATILQPSIVRNQLKIEGFLVNRFADRTTEGIKQNLQWVQEGKLKYREHIIDGFESTADAFIGLFNGANTGKSLVRII
ncbi:prostaglandin reductase 1-like isoform X2 [Achroia grisella]|uniref:prostaglandin reductase 1-like isoform X2 n=1 Tax=Achroia grisella TaxID=688607 RepID=UPI0027D227F7|nr:prostaglandin reductase 1-like isoform X2 [Achroia grisella]